MIVLMAFFLSFYNFAYDGFGNLYYSAAVKSMAMSWHNFFYVSFDPAGFISVDKPPVTLWIETAFVKLFGFHSFSLMLPQALAVSGSVIILYHLVKKRFGFAAGCVAALLLAVTPIFIAAARSNNPDAVLVLVLLLAAWSTSTAIETGYLRYVVLTAVLLGIGFNTKMLVAYLILPAIVASYLFGVRIHWKKKALHLGIAVYVLLVVSFCWVAAVDLTPTADRPYVGSSSNNTEMNLVFGYNGLNRLDTSKPIAGNRHTRSAPSSAASGVQTKKANRDTPGPLRMLEIYIAEQVSWFLPLAAIGAVGAYICIRGMKKEQRRSQLSALLFWGCWTATMLLFFSFYRNLTHRYYLNLIAPGIAALGGIGFAAMVKQLVHRGKRWQKMLLPAGLILSAVFHLIMLWHYPAWFAALWPLDTLCIGLAIALPVIRMKVHGQHASVTARAAYTALACLLVTPAAWSFTTVMARVNGSDAYAGPGLLGTCPVVFLSPAQLSSRLGGDVEDPSPSDEIQSLSKYLIQHKQNATYLAATPSTAFADKIILYTGQPIMAIGGYNGSNPVLSLDTFRRFVRQGKVRYLLIPASSISSLHRDAGIPSANGWENNPNLALLDWAVQNGSIVNSSAYLVTSDTGANDLVLVRLASLQTGQFQY